MPWLLWCFEKQTWQEKELIVIDSSANPWGIAREGVQVISAPVGTNVPKKRNLALQHARGEIVAWFDDDDWQHPERLRRLVEALETGAPFAGPVRSWFVDPRTLRCELYRGSRHILFNGAGFRAELARGVPFDPKRDRGSDAMWMRELGRHNPGARPMSDFIGFFWLVHDGNISNPRTRRRCTERFGPLRVAIGDACFDGTTDALDALNRRLGHDAGLCRIRDTAPLHPRRDTVRGTAHVQHAPAPTPVPQVHREPDGVTGALPVSVMIKAALLDASYLEVMVPHMIAQARYPFAERVLVVDRRAEFTGKYRDRPASDRAAFDKAIDRLRSAGSVDRVVEVSSDATVARDILSRFFGPDGARVPEYASTGGPIYPTLFGMQSLATDHVVQMDCDVLFHTDGESWVARGVDLLRSDPSIWLTMSHPGPPAGPPGRSMEARNARRAAWDAERQIWRFPTATTRYFLCDRRTLYGRLRLVPRSGGCAPLEACISNALDRHGACRASTDGAHSWHLHAWSHAPPFPEWASRVAALIELGRYPALQRGAYDLRLDKSADRAAWAELVTETRPAVTNARSSITNARRFNNDGHVAKVVEGISANTPARPALEAAQVSSDSAPISVVIPIRNRPPLLLERTLSSLAWQTSGPPAEVHVVSHGSEPALDTGFASVCGSRGARLLRVGRPEEPWNKPFALNVGLRDGNPSIPLVMVLDGDIILAKNFLAVVLECMARTPTPFVLCRALDLPAKVQPPGDSRELLAAFDGLRNLARPRARSGTGGVQACTRDFFHRVRGYDEDLAWWGAMDGDMVARARSAGLPVEWIDDRTSMLHQWHPRKHAGLPNGVSREAARRSWRNNHDLVRARNAQGLLQRNPQNWGGLP